MTIRAFRQPRVAEMRISGQSPQILVPMFILIIVENGNWLKLAYYIQELGVNTVMASRA